MAHDRPITVRLFSAVCLIALLLAAAGCGDDADVSADGEPTATTPRSTGSDTTEYRSVAVTEDGAARELVDDTVITLTFGAGEIGASLGCNQMSGDYELEGDVLVVGQLAMTEMGCPPERMDQDRWFAELLQSRPTLRIDGDTLVLAGAATTVTFRERSVVDPDRPLVGTTWTVTGFVDGDVAMSMAVDEPGTLELTEDGWVMGSDGCNGFGYGSDGSGLRYEVDGDSITFSGDAVWTLKSCPEVAEYQQRYRTVLGGTVRWSITADQLSLTAPDGRGVTYQAAD